MPQETIDPPVKALHTNLVSQKYPVPDYPTFEADMKDPAKAAALHKNLVSQGWPLPAIDRFTSDMAGEVVTESDQPKTWGQEQGEQLKKKEEAKRKLASGEFSFGSSVADVLTAPEAYSPEKKKPTPDEQKDIDLQGKIFTGAMAERLSPTPPTGDLGKPHVDPTSAPELLKKNYAATDQQDQFDFLASKVRKEDHDIKGAASAKAGLPAYTKYGVPINQPTTTEDIFSVSDSKTSYDLSKSAFGLKNKMLQDQIDKFHDDPKTKAVLEQADQLQHNIKMLEAVQQTGKVEGKFITPELYHQVMQSLSVAHAQAAAMKKTPAGEFALSLVDQTDSMYDEQARIEETFPKFIKQDADQKAHQLAVDAVSAENTHDMSNLKIVSPEVTKPVFNSILNWVKEIAGLPKMIAGGSKTYNGADEVTDRAQDAIDKINATYFTRPSKWEEAAFAFPDGHLAPLGKGTMADPLGIIPMIAGSKLPSAVYRNPNSWIPFMSGMMTSSMLLVAPAGWASKIPRALNISKSALAATIGAHIGLVSSSFVQNYDENYKNNLRPHHEGGAGLSRSDASLEALGESTAVAMLEEISPRFWMAGLGGKPSIGALLRGPSFKASLKAFAGNVVREGVVHEPLQEISQSFAKFLGHYATNQALGKNMYRDVNPQAIQSELGQVTASTLLMSLMMSAGHYSSNPMYTDAVRFAATNPEFLARFRAEAARKNIPLSKLNQVLKDIGSIKTYGPDEVGYVDKHHNIPLTKEQAEKLIATGNLQDLAIYNDPAMESLMQQKFKEIQAQKKKDGNKKAGKKTKIWSVDELINDNQVTEMDDAQAKLMIEDQDANTARTGRVVTLVKKAMKAIAPSTRLVMLRDQEHAAEIATKLGAKVDTDKQQFGFYDAQSKTAFFVNNSNSLIHEAVMHPIIDVIKHEAPQVYDQFVGEIGGIMDDHAKGTTHLDVAKKNYNNAGEKTINEEAIVHFLTKIADGKITDKTTTQKFVAAVEKFFHLDQRGMMVDMNNPVTLRDFANIVAKAVAEGRPIQIKPPVKPTEKKTNNATEKEPVLTTPEKEGLKFQMEAMHGSPALFDHFNTDKVGEGYGANKFGWGLYFSEKEGIAKTYAAMPFVGKVLPKFFDKFKSKDGTDVAKKLSDFSGDADLYRKDIEARGKKLFNNRKANDELAKLGELEKAISEEGKGRVLYNVDIHKGKAPSEYDYLKWNDKLTPEQAEKIKALGFKLNDEATGKEVYMEIADKAGSQKAASNLLLENGIDGIKYPVEGVNKEDASGHNNLVVFDPRAVSIKQAIKFHQEDKSRHKHQAGVTTYRDQYKDGSTFDPVKFEETRKVLEKAVTEVPTVTDYKVHASEGEYHAADGTINKEPTFDVEFVADKGADISGVLSVIDGIQKDFEQEATLFSTVVDKEHPNARPFIEITLAVPDKNPPIIDEVKKLLSGVDVRGFTMTADKNGNTTGLRTQFVPEFESEASKEDGMKRFLAAQEKLHEAYGNSEHISYITTGFVDTKVKFQNNELDGENGNAERDVPQAVQGTGTESSGQALHKGDREKDDTSSRDQAGGIKNEGGLSPTPEEQYTENATLRHKIAGILQNLTEYPRRLRDDTLSDIAVKVNKILQRIDEDSVSFKEEIGTMADQMYDRAVKLDQEYNNEYSHIILRDATKIKAAVDGLRFSQEPKDNATTKKLIAPEDSPLENLHREYAKGTNGDLFEYEPQSIKEELVKMAAMSQADLVDYLAARKDNAIIAMMDQMKSSDNFGLLGAIELLKRAHAKNDAALEAVAFGKIKTLGSGVGQLLRQMRELYSMFPTLNKESRVANDKSLITKVIRKLFTDGNIHLTPELSKTLDGVVSNFLAARELENTAKDNLKQAPTAADSDAWDKAQAYTDLKYSDIMDFIDTHLPVGAGSNALTIMKGNLLTAGSIIVNTISNMNNAANQVIGLEGHGAALGGAISRRIANKGKGAGFSPTASFVAMGFALKAFVKGWAPAIKQSIRSGGMRSRELSKFEVNRQLHPAKSLMQILNPKTLPKRMVTKNGKTVYETPINIWASKLMEGTFGWPAALWYRGLYVTDKPFAEAGKAYAGFIQFKAEHPNGKASEFGDWLAKITDAQKAKIQQYSNKFTYNDPNSWAAISANNIVGGPHRAAKEMELEGGYGVLPTVLRTIQAVTVPYVGVPSNIAQHLLELAFPPAAWISARYHHNKGNHEIAGMLAARGATGIILYLAAGILANAGLFIDNDDDPKKDKNDIQLKHAVARPSAINLTGLVRFLSGGDGHWQKGDRSINMQKLGIQGVFFNYYANFHAAMGEKKMNEFSSHMMDSMLQAGGSTTKMLFTMSFLNGANTLLEGIAGVDKEGASGFTGYAAKSVETLSNIVWPNQASQIYQAWGRDNLMRASDPSLLGNIHERMAKRGFYFGALSTDNLNPVLDIWGQPVKTTAGETLNPMNMELATDEEAIKIFNLTESVNAHNPITIPNNTVKISADDGIAGVDSDTSFKLSEVDGLVMQALVGRFKKAYLRSEFADPEFDSKSAKEKLDIIKDRNEEANENGRELFLDMFWENVAAGKLKFDAIKGTYDYVEPQKYDQTLDEKLINEEGVELPRN